VTPDQAHNLTLVINELVTNTIKYALREQDVGHITVRISLEDDTIQFEFRDDGPGYPQEVLSLERCGVGLDLIQNIARRNLRGELSLHNDRGAVATIRFKAEAQMSTGPPVYDDTGRSSNHAVTQR
jgi:two-component sensor histidine kinase